MNEASDSTIRIECYLEDDGFMRGVGPLHPSNVDDHLNKIRTIMMINQQAVKKAHYDFSERLFDFLYKNKDKKFVVCLSEMTMPTNPYIETVGLKKRYTLTAECTQVRTQHYVETVVDYSEASNRVVVRSAIQELRNRISRKVYRFSWKLKKLIKRTK